MAPASPGAIDDNGTIERNPVSITEDTTQVVADLKAARAELVRRGRCIGHMVRDDGSVCTTGAIGVAIDVEFESHYMQWARLGGNTGSSGGREWSTVTMSPRFWAVKRALRQHVPDGSNYVEGYNDKFTTTDADVLNLFDKALAELGGLGDE